ncbi:hypothetical protein HMPREF1170_02680 [Aeromonas veronii AMC35]|nr:hypothetical protein HMPREF1170_02680 [Aeromonas veronii AMC35]TNJ03937.1 hypothetical protein CF117_10125 [Aeromonas veronii]
MKDMESPYPGAVITGLGVVMPHPKQPDKFVLPGGTICNRTQAEGAARVLHNLQAKPQSKVLPEREQ